MEKILLLRAVLAASHEYGVWLQAWHVAVLAGAAVVALALSVYFILPEEGFELTRRQAFLLAIPGVNVVAFIVLGLAAHYRAVRQAGEEAVREIKQLLAQDDHSHTSADI